MKRRFEYMLTAAAVVFRSRGGFLVTVFIYLAMLAVLRGTLFPGLAEDDSEQLFYAQSWALGYKGSQPPLYTWLVKLAEQALGVGVGALFVVKFGVIFAFYAFCLAAARRLINDPLMAGLAALSPVALYYVGWDGVVNYSNTNLLAAAQAATLLALLRLNDGNKVVDYVWLGLAVAAGLLAKYNFVLFALPLLAAGLAHPGLRARLLSPRLLVSALVAAAVVAPHAYWALTDAEALQAVAASTERPWKEAESWFLGALFGLGNLAAGGVAFLMPMILILLLFFPRAFGRLAGRASATTRFFAVYFGAYAVLVSCTVLAIGATDVQNHWLLGLLPVPLYVFARLEAAGGPPPSSGAKWYPAVLSALALLVAGALVVRAMTAPTYCRKCNFFMPWHALSEQLRGAGFERGTIVAFDYPNQIAGNLRRYFPEARVMSQRLNPRSVPPAKAPGGCLVIWNQAIEPEGNARRRVLQYANRMLGTAFKRDRPFAFVESPIEGSGGRTVRLGYVLEPDGTGNCR